MLVRLLILLIMTIQTRNPTSDEAVSGTWSGTAGSRWTVVDDFPDTAGTDELTHGTTAGVLTFGFSPFTVPSGSTSITVRVKYYDYKSASQSCTFGGRLKVGGSYFNATTHNPANGSANRTLRTDTWATNPATSAAWTAAEVNALAAFGYNSGTDASPTIITSSIQIEVEYTPPAPAAGDGFVNAVASLSGDAKAILYGSGSINAVASLSGTGSSTHEGSGIVNAVASLVGAGFAPASTVPSGSGIINAVASLTGDGSFFGSGFGIIDTIGSLVGSGNVQAEGSGTINSVGSLVGRGLTNSRGSGTTDSVATLTGNGATPLLNPGGSGTIAGFGSLLATGQSQHAGTGVINASASIFGEGLAPTGPVAQGGWRSFFGWWFGGLSSPSIPEGIPSGSGTINAVGRVIGASESSLFGQLLGELELQGSLSGKVFIVSSVEGTVQIDQSMNGKVFVSGSLNGTGVLDTAINGEVIIVPK